MHFRLFAKTNKLFHLINNFFEFGKISSISKLSHDKTISLIGVTMTDTKPQFFDLLDRSGFKYQRLDDQLMQPVRCDKALFY